MNHSLKKSVINSSKRTYKNTAVTSEEKKKKIKHFDINPSTILAVGAATATIAASAVLSKSKKVDSELKEISQPREYTWGLGIEHEIQIFHIPKSGMIDANIMFDSQESTCWLTGDKSEEGSCCKTRKDACFKHAKESEKVSLSDEEITWLSNVDWELSGRQAEGCKDGRIILPRTPILMPELVTGNFKNRSIESINQEIVYLEEKFIDLQMKNPHTRQKVEKYGPLKTHACNFLSDIKVPKSPTINSKDYSLDQLEKYKDYLGSYHVTITLPHFKDVSIPDFVNMHRFFGMQFQWIEPLFNGIYFSPDPDSVASGPEKVQGSARIMIVGWGNLGGADLRKLGQTKEGTEVPFDRFGIGRATNIKSYWRDQIKFEDSSKLDLCAKTAPPNKNYSKFPKKALSIHTSDIRTFETAQTYEECIQKGSNPNDCVNLRVDAAPMTPPFGMELRIFDHFDSVYLLDLMRVLILLAANSQRFNPTKYVYKNKAWIDAVGVSMREGWNGILPKEYIKELRNNLGLKIKTESLRLDHVYTALVKELYALNHESQICKMMMENPDVEPSVPMVNRYCWELSFNKKFNKPVIDFIKTTYKHNKLVSMAKFKNDFLKHFEEYLWRDDIEDLLYALETKRKVDLNIEGGKIKSIRIL
jgi:hypothetical protein